MKQEVDKKTALIVGLGASGLACAHHLGRRGWKIRAADTREAPAGAQRLGAEMPDAKIRTGGLPESLLDGVSLVVMSPGLSTRFGAAAPLVASARARGIEVVGEIELFARALADLEARTGYRPVVIGVTGTNGKTTVTTLIKHMLEQCLHTKVGLIGTNANVIGDEVLHTEHTTPDAYELQKLLRRMVDAGCTHAVMEVSSHSLVLHRVEGIRFRVGIFTNLSQDHLDFHKTMEAYAAAKAQLFAQSDVGIVNADDDWAHVMLEHAKCPMHTYSAKRNDADLVAKDIRLSASGVRFVAMHGDAIARMRLGIPGMFSVYNALSVIACACALGISLDDCAAALDTAKPVKGRAEVLETDGDYAILIDYAVTPDAIDNILTTVREFAPARLVFLFGCGGDRDRGKRPKMGRIAGQKADFVIVTSDNPRTEDPEAIIADILPGLKETHTPYVVRPDRREAIAYAIENHCPGDVIILCGKGHEDYQIIGKTKVHMDEREIVAEILEKRKREK